MQIKLLTLNLWRYYDFKTRLNNIISEIERLQPDVVFLQEVQIDPAISPFSQVELIKKSLKEYEYSIHSTIYSKKHQRGEILDTPIQHGMAVLSKYPITDSFEYYLKQSEDEKGWCLDYFLIPKFMKYLEIESVDKYLSDHKAVFVKIETKAG